MEALSSSGSLKENCLKKKKNEEEGEIQNEGNDLGEIFFRRGTKKTQ